MGPRDVALRILEELFREDRPIQDDGPASAYTLATFQREGVARLDSILRRYGGAVLADGVGLGKTYMALALVESELRAGGDAVIVVPAATRRAWRLALRDLADARGRWHLLSHTQLARGAEADPATATRMVVVDEAHRFRNPDTLRYRALARLVAPSTRLLLITATPVNNRLDDLRHLLCLFAPDHAFRDLGVSSLRAAFEAADPTVPRGGRGDAALGTVVDAVVVRRTRAMVRARFGEAAPGRIDTVGPRFPNRAAPRAIRYDLRGLDRRAERIAALELAPYDLPAFGAPGRAGSVPTLLRLGLVKRLDSSTAALQASMRRLDIVLSETLEAARRGRVPVVRWGEGRGGDADPLQLSITSLVTRPAPPALDLNALAASLLRDLDRVRDLLGSLDSKLDALIALLAEIHDEKVLVFTEYRDTAESLWTGLSPRFRVARVDGSGAWLGRHPACRRAVVERFAPRANGQRPPPARERVDVLVATDVLAEGLNLQDARHVVSYDLPWNPVRLLQRIGRLDRLGSPHDEIVPYLFLPTEGLDDVLGLTRRLRDKLGDIARTVGTGEGSALLVRLGGRPAALAPGADAIEESGSLVVERDEGESPGERLRTLWVRHRSTGPPELELAAPATERPGPLDAAATVRRVGGGGLAGVPGAAGQVSSAPEWVVLAVIRPRPERPDLGRPVHAPSRERQAALLEVDRDGAVRPAGDSAVAVLRAALDDHHCRDGTPPAPPERAVLDYLRSRAGAGCAPAPLSPHDPGRRLALELRRRLLREGARADRRTITRADALQRRLASPLDTAARRAIRGALDRCDSLSLTELLDRADRALAAVPLEPLATSTPAPSWTVVAALYVERVHASRPTPPGG